MDRRKNLQGCSSWLRGQGKKKSREDSKWWGRNRRGEIFPGAGWGSDVHGSGSVAAGTEPARGREATGARRGAEPGRAGGGAAAGAEQGRERSPFLADRERAGGRAKPNGRRFAWLEPKGDAKGRLEPARPPAGGEPRRARRPPPPGGAAAAERSLAGQTRVSWPGSVKAERAAPDLLPQTHTHAPPRPSACPPSLRPRLPPLPAGSDGRRAKTKPPSGCSWASPSPQPAPGLQDEPRREEVHRPWAASRPPRRPWDSSPGSQRSRPTAPLSARSRAAKGTRGHGPGGAPGRGCLSLPQGPAVEPEVACPKVRDSCRRGCGFQQAPAGPWDGRARGRGGVPECRSTREDGARPQGEEGVNKQVGLGEGPQFKKG